MMDPHLKLALQAACHEAELHRGATAPNPPVGAAGLDRGGNLLSVQAHLKAGQGHAERRLFEDLKDRGLLEKLHTVVVTLEPCNHTGRTLPCAEQILQVPSIRRVFYAFDDPNPMAQGGGERLKQAGLEVVENLSLTHPDAPEIERARDLSRPFFHWIRTRLPWVTVKTAWRDDAGVLTMLPRAGEKTFTSESSLRLAHELRRRSDAILTGSGTVLADWPEFTVRRVPDHPGKSRWLVILDRRGRVPEHWTRRKTEQGFQVKIAAELSSLLAFLGSQGVLEVLVEAGPTLSGAILSEGLWNEHFRILHQQGENKSEDRVQRELNVHWHY